jgi:serine/threonine protein kinase
MAVSYGGWQKIKPLGEGGQSNVYLVSSKSRQDERSTIITQTVRFKNVPTTDDAKATDFLDSIGRYSRHDEVSELGALKVFNIPPVENGLTPTPDTDEYEAVQRLNTEIFALQQKIPGLPRLLDFNDRERWIVTEYFPNKTLEDQPTRYRGNVLAALKAFRSLVQTVKSIHKLGMVHRDIKPANVFIRGDEHLVLGDFGIVYLPGAQDRVTVTGERVGPRDYMPRWANLGRRHDSVKPNMDIFMLGKLLWSMVDGRALLPFEYHRHPQYDFNLTVTFPDDPSMHLVNRILDKCVVEHENDCTISAEELLLMVDTTIRTIERGGQLLNKDVPRPCHICGVGFYDQVAYGRGQQSVSKEKSVGLRVWVGGGATDIETLNVYTYACSNCGHVEFFTRAASSGNQTC